MSSSNQGMSDPYLSGSFSLKNRLMRFMWDIVYAILFRPSPRPFHGWRAFLLRCFGARLGKGCHIYPKARIWAPWNLICEDVVAIADEVIVYNPELIYLGAHSVISQQAYLCGASHDPDDWAFPLIAKPIHIGAYAWVCARATVQLGVNMAEGAVLGLGGVATRDMEPWTIYGGIPARKIKNRVRHG